jgi:hypothetical protein
VGVVAGILLIVAAVLWKIWATRLVSKFLDRRKRARKSL